MFSVYSLKTIDSEGIRIYLASTVVQELGIADKRFIIISFGLRKTLGEIEVCSSLQENEIGLTKEIFQNLFLPLDLKIQIKIISNELVIGPCIGILISHGMDRITPYKLKRLLKYTILYKEIAGAVLVFTPEKIDFNNKLVEAYCYSPKTNSFLSGKYPFPSAVYRRSGLNKKQKKKIKLLISNNIFNSYYFNKWEMYQWFSKDDKIRNYLPETKLYNQYEDISEMLKKYGSVFLKPISGMQGKKIIKISKKDETLICEYSENNTNKKESFYRDSGKEFLCEFFKKEKYLLQQPIELIQNKESIIDFRVIMQKGLSGEWTCNGIIARLGNKDSVVSNVSSGGSAVEIDKFLRDILCADEIQIFIFKEKIKLLAFKICEVLSKRNLNLGTLGLDIGIDKSGKPWIIEINNRDPDPTIALDAGNRLLYYKLISYPLLYAKYLAGFGHI